MDSGARIYPTEIEEIKVNFAQPQNMTIASSPLLKK